MLWHILHLSLCLLVFFGFLMGFVADTSSFVFIGVFQVCNGCCGSYLVLCIYFTNIRKQHYDHVSLVTATEVLDYIYTFFRAYK